MYMILTHYADPETHDVRRQVLVYSKNSELALKLKDFFDTQKELDCELVDFGTMSAIENCYTWQNHKTDYSRKKIEPLLIGYFKNN
jgi:hypothetical protein